MLVQALNLGLRRASGRQRWQGADRKEVHPVGLVTGRWRATRELTQKKQLVDVMDAGRVAVGWIVLVEEGRELDGLGQVTGFLADLALDRKGGPIADIDPASRESPLAIGTLPNQQHLVLVEDSAAHVDLRRRVAVVPNPQGLQLVRRDREVRSQDSDDQ